jgi:hypothetical protein
MWKGERSEVRSATEYQADRRALQRSDPVVQRRGYALIENYERGGGGS